MKRTCVVAALVGIWVVLAPPLAAQGLQREDETSQGDKRARAAAEQQLREAERAWREAERQLREAERQLRDAAREVARHAGALAERQADRVLVLLENRPRLGLILANEMTSVAGVTGVEVVGVTPGGPADEAGIRVGDVLVKVNGTAVAKEGDRRAGGRGSSWSVAERMGELVAELEEGEPALLEIRRGESTHTIRVVPRRLGGPVLESWRGHLREFDLEHVGDDLGGKWGSRVRKLRMLWRDVELVGVTPELGEYFGTPDGVLVTRVPADASFPLKPGDVILRVDGRPATSPAGVLGALASGLAGEGVSLEVLRKGKVTTLTVGEDLAQSEPAVRPSPPLSPAAPAQPRPGESM